MSRKQDDFAATHHALLFAWLSQAVCARVGAEQGEALMRKAVRRYGEERGRRMALRAKADGEPLSMANFMAYGELPVDPGPFQSTTETVGHALRRTIRTCPWHTAWAENDLLMYGRLYCLEIDEALVRGFNPALRLDVNHTQPNDGVPCEFVFHDVSETGQDRGQAMPWPYHLGHLYSTIGAVIVGALGEPGEAATSEALARFGERFGEDAARAVLRYRGEDFGRLGGEHEGHQARKEPPTMDGGRRRVQSSARQTRRASLRGRLAGLVGVVRMRQC